MAKKGSGRRETVRTKNATLYVQRDGQGRFKDGVEKGSSLGRDRRRKAAKRVKSGYGHRGDRVA